MSEQDMVQRSLGKIEGMMEGMVAEAKRLSEQLAAHTKQDDDNFESLREQLSLIVGSRAVAAKWGAVTATVVSAAVAAAVQALAG